MKWPNIFKVFRWEFLKNLKSPVFLVTTLMMPLVMALAGGISYFSSVNVFQEETRVAVIDEVGDFYSYLEPNLTAAKVGVSLHEGTEREQLSAEVQEGELNGYLVFTQENIESGLVEYYVKDAKDVNIVNVDTAVTGAITQYRMEKMGLTAEEISQATAPVALYPRALSGEEISVAAMVAPMFFSVLLVIAVMVSGQVLMYGVIKEKRNRIIEILLSSVSALELLLGKILGFGLLGLFQIGLWLTVGLVAASRFMDLRQLDLTFAELLPMLLFFLGGYLMFAALFAAMGATMKDAEGGSQTQGLVVLIPLIPMFAASGIMMSPNALWVKVFSYIPIFTPMTMLMRIGVTSLPWWELATTFGALMLGVAFFIYLGARIFSRGLLQFERTLSIKEIGRMMRKDY